RSSHLDLNVQYDAGGLWRLGCPSDHAGGGDGLTSWHPWGHDWSATAHLWADPALLCPHLLHGHTQLTHCLASRVSGRALVCPHPVYRVQLHQLSAHGRLVCPDLPVV